MKFNNLISTDTSILECLKRMDEIGRKLLILVESNHFKGVLSIGDIQRAIINKVDLNAAASSITREIITVASIHDSKEEIRRRMIALRAECMPIIDDEKRLLDVVFWEDIIDSISEAPLTQINVPVVIMAGGKGTRLRPLTNVIPKPLIPFGKETMLETIMNSFKRHGCMEFHISLNYKAELIQYYLENNASKEFTIHYFKEESPLGTAGSLHLLKNKITSAFFVSNCDIIVDQDYGDIMEYHRSNGNELTVVAALKHLSIPYGTIETEDSGILTRITEKPELTYMINSGLYILEPNLIHEIPENTFYHITSLISQLTAQKRRVGVFPVSEKSWKDVGEWKEYANHIKEHS